MLVTFMGNGMGLVSVPLSFSRYVRNGQPISLPTHFSQFFFAKATLDFPIYCL